LCKIVMGLLSEIEKKSQRGRKRIVGGGVRFQARRDSFEVRDRKQFWTGALPGKLKSKIASKRTKKSSGYIRVRCKPLLWRLWRWERCTMGLAKGNDAQGAEIQAKGVK